jgi:hypothetical protein
VGGDDDVLGDYVAPIRLDPALHALSDVERAGVLEEVAAVPRDLLGQRQEVLADVELRLVLEADRPLYRERERRFPHE